MADQMHQDLSITPTRDELSRQHFMSGMRHYVLHNVADGMRSVYERKVEPRLERQGQKPRTGPQVHKALRPESLFKFYSSLRCNAQEMVWRSVIPTVERNAEDLNRRARVLSQSGDKAQGTLDLDPTMDVPRYVSDIDVHLVPGCYHTEYAQDDVSQGAIYDHGGAVFTMGLLGDERDDIGGSISLFIRNKYPDFHPQTILDLGCGLGNNTMPWAQTYPDADVHAADVAAPLLRYANARAQSKGVTMHFHQQDAEHSKFADESVDLIFTSMFLHELPAKTIGNVLKECHRMLRPGGLMLHMELPPNNMTAPYDSFYLDWDSYYNREPFYKAFRDMDPEEVCAAGGFSKDRFVFFTVPSRHLSGPQAILDSIDQDRGEVNSDTGRMSKKIHWFCFGAWK